MLTTSTTADDTSQGIAHDLREIVHDVWASRNLLLQLTLRDIRVRYKQAYMGFAWAVLTPLLVVSAGIVVRVALLNVAGAPLDRSSLVGVVVKGLAWSFVSAAIGFSANVLTLNAGLIGKIYFPRETLPLSVMLASTFDTLIAVVAIGIILPFLGWRPTVEVLWVPLVAVTLFALTFAISLLASCGNLFFRDVKYLVQLLTSFGIFFTPIFYEPHALGARTIPLQMVNPLAPLVEGLRLAIANRHNLLVPIRDAADGAVIWSPAYLIYSVVFTALALVVSAVIFHRSQYRFAEYI
jgi:ABC-type polysaccharide/polyol phosphate export systems, permease component